MDPDDIFGQTRTHGREPYPLSTSTSQEVLSTSVCDLVVVVAFLMFLSTRATSRFTDTAVNAAIFEYLHSPLNVRVLL